MEHENLTGNTEKHKELDTLNITRYYNYRDTCLRSMTYMHCVEMLNKIYTTKDLYEADNYS